MQVLSSLVSILTCVTEIRAFPTLFPQTNVCTVNLHTLPSVGMSVQLTVVWWDLEVVGQLPQLDSMLKVAEQSEIGIIILVQNCDS